MYLKLLLSITALGVVAIAWLLPEELDDILRFAGRLRRFAIKIVGPEIFYTCIALAVVATAQHLYGRMTPAFIHLNGLVIFVCGSALIYGSAEYSGINIKTFVIGVAGLGLGCFLLAHATSLFWRGVSRYES